MTERREPLTIPAACTSCAATAGFPYLEGTNIQRGALHVALRCAECGHEWERDIPTGRPRVPLLARPRPDRRQARR